MTINDARTVSPAQESIKADAARLSRRTMLKGSGAMLAALGFVGTTGFSDPGTVQATEKENIVSARQGPAKPRIVLVHGAWADGTGWQHIIPLLEEEGFPVIAVQNPLTSIADDVATTKRVIDAEGLLGPVIVVGHSYGFVRILNQGSCHAYAFPQERDLSPPNWPAPDLGRSYVGATRQPDVVDLCARAAP